MLDQPNVLWAGLLKACDEACLPIPVITPGLEGWIKVEIPGYNSKMSKDMSSAISYMWTWVNGFIAGRNHED